MSRYVLVVCAACGASPPPPSPAPPSAPLTTIDRDATALVDAWATAAGGRDRLAKVRAIHARGKIEHGGLAGRFDRWETSRGERRDDVDLDGVDHVVHVFDGTHGWVVDRNKNVRDLDGPELAEQAALAYLDTWAALLPDRRAGKLARAGDTLVLEPAGGRTLTVAFDPATHLPTAIARRDAEKTRVLKLGDWRDVAGVKLPFAIEDGAGDPRDTIVTRADAIELDAAGAPAFVRPPDSPHDWHLASATATIPVELVKGLIVVQAQVNGSPPQAFLVDTGAEVTVINASRLAKLGLAPVGKFAVGAGGGDAAMSYVKDVTFAMPGVTLDHQIVTAIPLDDLEPMFGHPIDGVLGYDFLSRFIVVVDYDKHTLVLSDPATFHYAGKGELLPITLEGGVPNAEAAIGVGSRPALTARFIVDTGCSCEVSFNAPFTAANKLVEAGDAVRPPGGLSRGAGGVTDQLLGHVTSLAIAKARVDKPFAEFAQDSIGAGADPESAGLLGGQLWRRFVVTLDYAHKRMWLERGPHFADADTAVGTGAVWQAKAGSPHDLEVAAVFPGSPAAEVGFAVGDRLVSLDGTAADKLTADELSVHDDRAHVVVVRRAGKTVTLRVTPRALF